MLERIEEYNRGSPQRPLDAAALREKFRANVEDAIGAGDAERIADAVLSLDRQDNVWPTMQLLSALNDTRRGA